MNLLLLLASLSLSQHSAAAEKMDLREISRNMAVKGHPSQSISADWVNSADASAKGVSPYRYMHAMVNAAIFGEKENDRKQALAWLGKYDCENWLACNNYLDYLKGAIEEKKLEGRDSAEFEPLKAGASQRAKLFSNQEPKMRGLCAPGSPRAAWLKLEYRLLCPTKAGENHLCPKCLDTNWLKKRIDEDSSQMTTSSSFLKELKHEGSADCSKPWKTTIVCGGSTEFKRTLRCEKLPSGEVECRE